MYSRKNRRTLKETLDHPRSLELENQTMWMTCGSGDQKIAKNFL